MGAIKGQPAPKPQSTPSPDPYSAFENDMTASYAAFDADMSGVDAAAQAAPPPEEPGVARQALDYGLRGLDYLGGLTRTGLAEVAGIGTQIAQGKNPLTEPQVVTPEDIKAALKGKAPRSAEYLRRIGVPEGGSLNVPGLGRVTIRGAAGLATDIATDPLTAVAKAVKDSPYLAKLFNAPGKASEALGEAVYKSALPAKAGDAADVVIQGLPEAGVAGAPIVGAKGMAAHVDQMSSTIGKLRQGLYDKASELGAAVNVAEQPLTRTEAVLSRMSRDPSLRPVAEELKTMVDGYKQAGSVPLDIMSEWKTNLYDSLPQSAWSGAGKLRGVAKQFKAALAGDFRDIIVNVGNKASAGLGDSIEALNSKWGALLSATKPIEQAAVATGGKLGTMVDGAVLAMGGIKAEAVKKGFDLATSPYAKTLVGKALMTAGKNGLATGLTNRVLINANQAPEQLDQGGDLPRTVDGLGQ